MPLDDKKKNGSGNKRTRRRTFQREIVSDSDNIYHIRCNQELKSYAPTLTLQNLSCRNAGVDRAGVCVQRAGNRHKNRSQSFVARPGTACVHQKQIKVAAWHKSMQGGFWHAWYAR
jgi:hypothetical protein